MEDIEESCRVCGCTNATMSSCVDWVEDDLCSECAQVESAEEGDDEGAGQSLGLCTILLALGLSLFSSTAFAGPFERPSWSDLDHNGRDTRADVLAKQCAYVTWDATGKRVTTAECLDTYSGGIVASDNAGQAFHVDHILPASEAWKRRAWKDKSGAACLSASSCEEYKLFYNDTQNLRVVRARTNRAKSDRMPAEWCPFEPRTRLSVAKSFRETAKRWSIPLTQADEQGLRAWETGRCAPGAVVLGGQS